MDPMAQGEALATSYVPNPKGGYALDRNGLLYGPLLRLSLSIQNGGHAPRRNRSLLRSSPSIQNGGTDTCWFVITNDQTLGFTTSFFGDGRISSYELDELGIVQLIQAVATGPDSQNDDVRMGASDLALSRDSAYLYQLNSINGTISAFRNNGDGTLTLIEQETPFPQPPFGPGGGEAGPIGLTAN